MIVVTKVWLLLLVVWEVTTLKKKYIYIYTKIHEIKTEAALIMKSLSSRIMGVMMSSIPNCNGVVHRAFEKKKNIWQRNERKIHFFFGHKIINQLAPDGTFPASYWIYLTYPSG